MYNSYGSDRGRGGRGQLSAPVASYTSDPGNAARDYPPVDPSGQFTGMPGGAYPYAMHPQLSVLPPYAPYGMAPGQPQSPWTGPHPTLPGPGAAPGMPHGHMVHPMSQLRADDKPEEPSKQQNIEEKDIHVNVGHRMHCKKHYMYENEQNGHCASVFHRYRVA